MQRSLSLRCLFPCSELTPPDKRWPDLKQPLTARWDEAATENGVRSNQRGCHDCVHFTPTRNQATGSAGRRADVTAAGRPRAERLDRKLGGWLGGWGGASTAQFCPSDHTHRTRYRVQPSAAEVCVCSKQMHRPLSGFVLAAKHNASTSWAGGAGRGAGGTLYDNNNNHNNSTNIEN